ncbi:MAG TPA: DUF2934 domain-containing protein [Xanthobacteraceae bacterium]|jgi:hypothetical protein
MDANLNARIRERAYEIWFATGCRSGEAEQHWLAAEREILHAAKPAIADKPTIATKQTSAGKASRPRSRATPKATAAN